MILTAQRLRVIERVDNRVLGAFRLVDAATEVPLIVPATIEARATEIVEIQPDGTSVVIQSVPLGNGAVDIRQNRVGHYVVFRAPLFENYLLAFENPPLPVSLQNPARRLRLRLGVLAAGPHHLPQVFDFDLPRPLDPADAASVFAAQDVAFFRAPNAPVQEGWAVLRVSVAQTGGGGAALPGVLIRVFRRPRQPADEPIGEGLTEWRGARQRGEALVPIAGLQRFAPGAGANVIETTHAIELEATRDPAFTGAATQLPDLARLRTSAPGTVRRPNPPADALNVIRPAGPIDVSAGEELSVTIEMP